MCSPSSPVVRSVQVRPSVLRIRRPPASKLVQLARVFPDIEDLMAHAARLAGLGVADDAALAAALRSGALDAEWESIAPVLAASARDQLLVANPSYLPAAMR